MAQLSDDCFAFGGPMMSVDEAVGLIAARVTPVVDVEKVSLARADGRILAHDMVAPLPLPPFTNSAVDGYAVASLDLPQNEERAFPVAGRVQAGGASASTAHGRGRRCASSPARRCRRAPIPCSCRKTSGSMATRSCFPRA